VRIAFFEISSRARESVFVNVRVKEVNENERERDLRK
jgi:hypothetical protein